MAENLSRFVIIDGVQIEKTRARRLGYIDDNGKTVKRAGKAKPTDVEAAAPAADPADDDAPTVETPSVDEPTSRRARGSDTARKG